MAESLIALEIVTPEGLKLAESVQELTAPSVEGEFGVLPSHIPMLAALTTGIVSYTKDGKTVRVAVGPGFFEFADDRAVVLTDKFIAKDDIDPVRVRLELKEVDQALDEFHGEPSSPEYAELVGRELWAAAQLDLYGDPPPPRIRTVSELESNVVESYLHLDSDAGESGVSETSDEGSSEPKQ
ncbi:MAG TPA: ATP synthase F1 subunit epsilon [Polyangiaceae bacterium]|nr:ATP synthase F1 subunit epsilon [Polyangiaceae bacterium]